MATEGQKKEIFDQLKVVVKDIIESNGFTPDVAEITITGEQFYNKFISLFGLKSLIIKTGIFSNKNDIIQIFKYIYLNNTDDILQLANAGGKDINVRTMNVMDFVIRKVKELPKEILPEYKRNIVFNNWEEYKRENPSGGRRRRFRTKKRKTKKYKRMSKRNRKF